MRPIAFLLTVLLLAPLAGCVTLGGSAEEAASDPMLADQQAMLFQPEPGLTPRDRYRKSLSLLETGQSGQAKAELRAYLTEAPDGRYAKRSRDLLRQIDVDPKAELGEAHFLYTMRSGDSLSSVAKRYLDDALKFYVLARYNDLDNPSQIKVGQVIKVPGEARPGAVQQAESPEPSAELEEQAAEVESEQEKLAATPEAEASEAPAEGDGEAEQPAEESQGAAMEDQLAEPSEEQTAEPSVEPTAEPSEEQIAERPSGEATDEATMPPAEESETQVMETEVERIQQAILKAEEPASAGDFQAAARQYESAVKQFPDDVMIKQLAAANYVTFADQLMGKGRLEDAATVLERAAELDPKSAEVEERLAGLERRQKANEFYVEGKKHLAADEPVEAFEAFDQATKIDPNHPAVVDRANLAPVAVEEYHRKAMIFFRRQDLDAALGVWDTKVLAIDPTYEPALLYRAQAIELKERLQDIPTDQPADQ